MSTPSVAPTTGAEVAVPSRSAGPRRTQEDVFRRQQARLGWMFSAPALLVIGAVTIFPIIYAIIMSVSNVNVTGAGVSLNGFTSSNYSTMVHAEIWRYALFFTIVYTVVTVAVEVVLGTCIALVLERLSGGRGWMMALLLIPWSMITVINAQLWSYIYNPTYGILDTIFSHIGLGSPVILGTRTPAIIALMVADVWKTTPFVAIIVLAGLVMLPQDLYEAAEVDGSTGWTTFWRITFPLLRPTIALAVLFRVLQAFGLFDLPFVLTSGGPGNSTTSLAILAYNAMFRDLEFGPGAAVATSTALLVVLGCIAFLKVFRAQVGREG
jgi:trehalose/maltose transport system permease protein